MTTAPTLTIEHHTSFSSFTAEHYHAWERCIVESHGSFFQSPLWVTVWWKHFSAQATLSLWFVREAGGRVTAVFPGMIARKRWWGGSVRVLSFIGGNLNEINEIACVPDRPESLAHVIDAIHHEKDAWDIMHVKEVSRHSSFFQILKRCHALQPSEDTFSVTRPLICKPSHSVPRDGAPLPALSKNDINRRFNMLKHRFETRIQLTHEAPRVPALIRQFSSMFARRSEETRYSSLFPDATHVSFFTELATSSGGAFHTHIASLSIPEMPIAFIYWLETPTTYTYYANTFDPEYFEFSPSSILMRELIRNFMSAPHMVFDLGRGEMPYKLRFANHRDENMEFISAPRHPLRRRITSWAWHLKPWLKRSPSAFRLLQGAKEKFLP